MEENNIFPEDILHNTVEYHIAKHSKKTNLIFWLIFLSLLGIFVALPFIYVDIYTTSRGIITSEEKPVNLYAQTSGKITYFNLVENKAVRKGDTLLIVDQKIITEKGNLLNNQKEDTENFIIDLQYLLKGRYSKIKTSKYRKEKIKYLQQLHNIDTDIKNATEELNTAKQLFTKDVIAKVEFDKAKLNLNKARDNRTITVKQAQLTWQNELTDYEQSLDNLDSNQKQLSEEKNMYILTAPINGELINVQGLNNGSIVSAGVSLANISPNKNLIIESFISPSDIGYISEGITAKYQVDSYNSNQWGFATGEITEVGKDIVQVNNTNIFKIRSSLKEKKLSLSNGASGTLKKGMTVTSRFFLTERSLFQLLFDSIDDWFNPYNNENE